MDYLQDLQSNWDEFGQTDPLWAILTAPSKKGNKWQLDEFFRTGQAEIDSLMQYLEEHHMPISKGRALDFGCGVGRLTQALARHFEVAEGVDIAPSMIELANKFNRCGARCKYYVTYDDLSTFNDETVDFIYTSNVLQHIKPRYVKNYIREFLRLLAPKGGLVFQLVNEATTFRGKLLTATYPLLYPTLQLNHRLYRAVQRNPQMQLHIIRREQIETILQDNGARVIDVATIKDEKYYRYVRYCAIKT